MNIIEEKILAEGRVLPGNVLKVDNFLNHQIDCSLMREAAQEFKRRFEGIAIDKILTIEASGIAIAVFLANIYDVPIVFAKKGETTNCIDDKYMSQAFSFTHRKMRNVFVSKPYLKAGERILIVDDFLADGQAMSALIDIAHQAGAEVMGLGVVIEKGQQQGGKKLREAGYHLESLAIIESMSAETGEIILRK